MGEFEDSDLPPVLDSLRREMKSEIGRVEAVLGTQVGAVEKTVTAKLDGLKWKFIAGVSVQVMSALGVLVSRHPEAATRAADAVGKAVGLS